MFYFASFHHANIRSSVGPFVSVEDCVRDLSLRRFRLPCGAHTVNIYCTNGHGSRWVASMIDRPHRHLE